MRVELKVSLRYLVLVLNLLVLNLQSRQTYLKQLFLAFAL